jgi:hypothetical protein
MHKESFIINRNTLLHVSTLLGHLQGELFVTVTLRLRFTVEWECAVDCVLRCFWRRELYAVRVHSTQSTAHSQSTVKCNLSVTVTKIVPEDDPAGSKHVGVCYDWWWNSLCVFVGDYCFCIIQCTDTEHIKHNNICCSIFTMVLEWVQFAPLMMISLLLMLFVWNQNKGLNPCRRQFN